MRKTWSITTTTRNPFRLRSQLEVLNRECVGRTWDSAAQIRFQVLLIKSRLYGYGEDNGFSAQFLNGLSDVHKTMFTDFDHPLSYENALAIFERKNYQDPAMRGRQSFNPFKKLGFVYLDGENILRLTDLGKYFLTDKYDLAEIFFRSFLKWQIPNPDSNDFSLDDGYDIKPFIGVLHLISQVNSKWEALGHDIKGLSRNEFILFAPTLVNYSDIERYADKIINLRIELLGKNRREKTEIFSTHKKLFAAEFIGTSDSTKIDKLLNNLRDYGDNAIRYFRFSNLIYIRGGGHIDLEPRRSTEINMLLGYDNGKSIDFETLEEYQVFLADINLPELPWETQHKYPEIISEIVADIEAKQVELGLDVAVPHSTFGSDTSGYKKYLRFLRTYRRELQEKDVHRFAQDIPNLEECITNLENIYSFEDRPLMLERLAALGLHALNDAIKIKPNYPVGDDNQPTFTAPANVPDIECFYQSANSICEVTMLTSRDQYYNEGQPVMRHLRDFEGNNHEKPSYCLFIAPSIHRDTLNTYWFAVKYEYEGSKQRIIPLTIGNFVDILKTLLAVKVNRVQFRNTDLLALYEEILGLSESVATSQEWAASIPAAISAWSSRITN